MTKGYEWGDVLLLRGHDAGADDAEIPCRHCQFLWAEHAEESDLCPDFSGNSFEPVEQSEDDGARDDE